MTSGQSEKPILGITRDRPVCVVSLLVCDGDRVLMGARRRTASEKRHPGVLSSLTQGIPPSLFSMLEGGDPQVWNDGVEPLDNQPSFFIGKEQHGLYTSAFVVEGLLVRKAGLASAIIGQQFQGEARAVNRALAYVSDPQGTDESEWTAMLTYALDLSVGAHEVPERTDAYDPLIWALAARVPEAVATRDAFVLVDSGEDEMRLNALEVCVSGLCVQGAARFFAGEYPNA